MRDLHPILRDEVYRIAREALRNAFNHARARHIEAEITYGWRVSAANSRRWQRHPAGDPGSRPLRPLWSEGMRERARQIGASLDIWSGVGTGTEIDLSVPGAIAYSKPPGRSRLQLFRKKVG